MISHISHSVISNCDINVMSMWGYTLRHLCSHIYLIIASQTVISLRCLCEITLWDLCDLTYNSYCDLKLWYHCVVPARLHFETTVISHISNTVIFLWSHCELAVMSHSWLGEAQSPMTSVEIIEIFLKYLLCFWIVFTKNLDNMLDCLNYDINDIFTSGKTIIFVALFLAMIFLHVSTVLV